MLLLLAACGSPGMSAPPPYDPANSPEAPTSCPNEAKGAKAAREAALGESAGEAVGELASSSVFALAECERKQFDGYDLDTPDDTAAIAATRRQLSTVKTLYEEVLTYSRPRWVIGALARTGDLHATYAAKIRRIRNAPEAEELARIVDGDARVAYLKALDASEAWPNLAATDAQVGAWIDAACKGAGADGARYNACKKLR
jgi:hypothetical protein